VEKIVDSFPQKMLEIHTVSTCQVTGPSGYSFKSFYLSSLFGFAVAAN
jgi:hypothetical protein